MTCSKQRNAVNWCLLTLSLCVVTLPLFCEAEALNCTKGSVLRHDHETADCNGPNQGGNIGSEVKCKRAAEHDKNYDEILQYDEENRLRDAGKPFGCLYDTEKNVYVFNELNTGLGQCSSEFQCVCQGKTCADCPGGSATGEGSKARCSNSAALGAAVIVLVVFMLAIISCCVLGCFIMKRSVRNKNLGPPKGQNVYGQRPPQVLSGQPVLTMQQMNMQNNVNMSMMQPQPYAMQQQNMPMAGHVPTVRPMVQAVVVTPNYGGPMAQPNVFLPNHGVPMPMAQPNVLIPNHGGAMAQPIVASQNRNPPQ